MIPVSEPSIGPRESEYVLRCLQQGWISSAGEYIDAFENAWSAYCGRRFGVAVSNGTVALQLAVTALGIGPGDEVIVPTFTIISCALAVLYAGATPIFVDSDPATWGMDPQHVESAISARTKAIMPVHIYGHPVDMDEISRIAGKHGLAIIEDAAEAHGAEYLPTNHLGSTWRRCGSFGDLSCFSFYANKIVTTGEGGMVLTDDPGVATRLRSLRNLAFNSERRFLHRELGFNFRLTNVQAAIGLAQVERVDELVARKRAIGHRYSSSLQDVTSIRVQAEQPWARSSWWMNGVLLESGQTLEAQELGRRLLQRGVETRPFFLGMHRQPALLDRGVIGDDTFPVADALAKGGLYLPSGSTLTDDQVDTVVDAVKAALA